MALGPASLPAAVTRAVLLWGRPPGHCWPLTERCPRRWLVCGSRGRRCGRTGPGAPRVGPDLARFADGQVEAAALVVSRGSVSRSAAAAELACCRLPGHFLPQGLDDVPEPPPRGAVDLGQPVERRAAHGGEGGILLPERQPLPHGCLLLRVVALRP